MRMVLLSPPTPAAAAAPILLDLAIAAPPARAAEIKLGDVGMRAQPLRGTVEHHAAVLHHVAVVRHLQ